MKTQFFSRFVKRAIDVLVSMTALVLLSPILIGIAILVAIYMGRPVIFSHQRPGLNGTPFTMIKFRTMNNKKDAQGNFLPDGERLTTFGKFIRSTSLDELPELWNVLKGDMSLVGPRPLMMEYLPRYSSEQARRHEAVPGVTGWAQINGRNTISWEEKFTLDVWYVDNWTLWLDFKILFLTGWKVLAREDISQANHDTIEDFMGSQSLK
jgi:sugar transferase EpsL